MKNQYGFVPKRYRQPDRYRLMGIGWCAIYKHPETGAEYHLQLMPSVLSLSPTDAKHIQVLRQDKDCRRSVSEWLTTIKAAVEVVDRLFS